MGVFPSAGVPDMGNRWGARGLRDGYDRIQLEPLGAWVPTGPQPGLGGRFWWAGGGETAQGVSAPSSEEPQGGGSQGAALPSSLPPGR